MRRSPQVRVSHRARALESGLYVARVDVPGKLRHGASGIIAIAIDVIRSTVSERIVA